MKRVLAVLWPTWPGLAVPGFWAGYIAYMAISGQLPSAQAVLVACWPLLPLYAGSCLLAAWGKRGILLRLHHLILAAAILAGLDVAVKAWITATPSLYTRPQTVLPGLLAIDPVHNIYGTMLAIPGAAPYITVLSILLVPVTILAYRYYLREEEPIIWGQAAFLGFLSGSLGKAIDLLMHGYIIDYLHIPGLPTADLADIYLLWVGAGCVLAASLCYPEVWPNPRRALNQLLGRIRQE